MTKQADLERRQVIREIRQSGEAIARKTFSVPDSASKQTVQHSLESAYNNPREDVSGVKYFDYCTKQAMAKFNERINKYVLCSIFLSVIFWQMTKNKWIRIWIRNGSFKGSSTDFSIFIDHHTPLLLLLHFVFESLPTFFLFFGWYNWPLSVFRSFYQYFFLT